MLSTNTAALLCANGHVYTEADFKKIKGRQY